MREQQRRRLWSVAQAALLLAALLAMILLSCGCSSQVQGGQAQKRDQSLSIVIAPDGAVRIQDDRSLAATTQPSAKSVGNTAPRLGPGSQSRLGEVSFDAIRSDYPFRAAVAAIFLVLAAGFWFLGRRGIPAVFCVCLAACAFLYPIVFVYAAIVMGAYLVYVNRKTIGQLVAGAANVIENAPPGRRDRIRTQLEAKQDDSTKGVVRAVRGK